MKQLFLLFVSLFAGFTHAQYVRTVNQFPDPRLTDAIIPDLHNNLFIADFNGTSVYKRDPLGNLTVFAGGFASPNGLAFDSQENLFVVDFDASAIYKLSYAGIRLDTFQIPTPSGIIKMQNSDTMIFTQYVANTLMKLAPDGVILPMHAGGLLNGPVGLAYDGSGQLFGANFNDREIYKIDADTVLHWATVPLVGTVTTQYLGFIAYARGSLWATAFTANQIFRVELSVPDSIEWFAGSTVGIVDGHVSIAKFNHPNGICTNLAGDTMYITDNGNGRLRMITDTPVALETASNKLSLKISPNPASNQIRLHFPAEFQGGRLEVIDETGRICISISDLNNETQMLSIDQLAVGTYILHLQQGENSVQAKLIKY